MLCFCNTSKPHYILTVLLYPVIILCPIFVIKSFLAILYCSIKYCRALSSRKFTLKRLYLCKSSSLYCFSIMSVHSLHIVFLIIKVFRIEEKIIVLSMSLFAHDHDFQRVSVALAYINARKIEL